MSPVRVRLLAVPFALLAFGLSTAAGWPDGPLRRWSGDDYWIFAPIAVACGAVPLMVYELITRRRPASLRCDADRQRFVAPFAPQSFTTPALIVGLWFAGQGVGIGVQDARLGHDSASFFWFLGIASALATAALFVNRPSLSLTPAGITADRFPRGHASVDWDEVVPAASQEPAKVDRRVVTLGLRGPKPLDQVGASGAAVEVRVDRLHVDPRFLAAAIRHYAEDPTHRAAIGTEAEHERLRDVLRRQTQPIS